MVCVGANSLCLADAPHEIHLPSHSSLRKNKKQVYADNVDIVQKHILSTIWHELS